MRRSVVALALLIVLAPAQAAAQAAQVPDPVAARLAGIDATLAEIVVLMRKQVEQQDLALALKRVELSTFLLVEANRSIDAKREERDLVDEMASMEEKQLRDLSDMQRMEGLDPDGSEARDRRAMLDNMTEELNRSRERVKHLDLQLMELENTASSQRQEIQRWQDMVDRYFSAKRE